MSFVYEQEMMEDCALGCSGGGGGGNVTASCWQLYEDYSYHYRREKHWDRSRYERFIKTVKFLYQHNNNNKSTSSTTRRRSYHVGLNKFADNLPVFYDWEEEWNQPWKDKAFFEPTNHNTTVRKRRLPKHILQKSSQDETTPLPSLLTPLVTAKSIVEHSHHHHHHHHRQDYPDKHRSLLDSFKMYVPKPSHHYEQPDNEPPQQELVLPKHMTGKAFEVAALPRNADGLELDLRTPKRHPRKDSFETSLNWATSNNPDGIPLVHDVFDQGSCGSCWAFVAAGTVETSAASHAGHEAFQEALHQQGSRKARRQAKRVATEAFAKANLSIQELMDCDVAADQGCTGGNPLLAFYYIHRYGLVSWEDYPYRGHAGQCRLGQIQNPVATVSSWGILPKNYEDRIELALRYIGPVAVAINGAHPAFINYQGGILNIPHCDQKANHALLIVGYGQQQTTKYWIARNSWGKDWGEEGYVRIQRGDGMKHTPGMCGIAKSPSIALGAKLNWDRRPLVKDRQEDPTSWRHHSREYGSRNGGSNNMEADCLQREDDYSLADLLGCHFDRFWYQHRAISLGMISVLGALLMTVMPLTFARRLRRKQRRRPLSNATLSSASMTGSSSPSSFGSLVGGGCGNSIKDNERQHLHRGGRHIIINCRGDKEERQNLQQQQQVGESTPLFSNAEQNYGSKETCFAAQTVKR